MTYENKYRTHTTADIAEKTAGTTVRVAGWVENIRDHGGIMFFDLRDHYGVLQVKAYDEDLLKDVSREFAVSVSGEIVTRDKDTFNLKISTGTVELSAVAIDVLGRVSAELPFEIPQSKSVGEDTRLKYRYLDLRNRAVHDRIVFRSRLIAETRRKMSDMGFLELQTPIITASSPEGARDFLVPSRKHHGKFYALPQAPQIFKQLYMVGGIDRYFQVAPCFRDEDARADRTAGEFYQLDMELAFAEQEDVFRSGEEIISHLLATFSDKPFGETKFKRIAFADSLATYGTDKPDLRNPLFLIDLTDLFETSDFKPFRGKTVKGLRVPQMSVKSKKFFKDMEAYALSVGMKGLGYVELDENGKLLGPIDKFLTDEQRSEVKTRSALEVGDVLYFIADAAGVAEKFAGLIRTEVGKQMGLIDDTRFAICWVCDFPMYEANAESGSPEFSHNPFSMPYGGLDALNNKNPLDIKAYQYDLVINGVELASGAIRNHDPETMLKAFEIAGYGEEDVKARFGALYGAFKFGAPPHGGMAFGVDRLLMLLTEEENIREVIAFPLNSNGQDVMLSAPSEVSEVQLREAHITIRHKG
ncbi:MAG: aspartate--tRNA ligase [Oscillospiraceae bacterium]|jgi:aspartyl-tRNA synthetase|nr:aspartate--tRNA ligase [Oscillospiraceae bacterium]